MSDSSCFLPGRQLSSGCSVEPFCGALWCCEMREWICELKVSVGTRTVLGACARAMSSWNVIFRQTRTMMIVGYMPCARGLSNGRRYAIDKRAYREVSQHVRDNVHPVVVQHEQEYGDDLSERW